jgi:hypothetical protein
MRWKPLALAVAFLLSAIAVGHVALDRRARFRAEDDLLFLPRASAIRLMSLGHTELAADLVFIRAIIYFGSQFQSKGEYKWLDNYLQTIVELDPKFRTPYRWAGVASIYNGREITNESVMLSNHFLELGVKQFPSDWELAFMLGCNYLFELKTDDPEQKKLWREIAGDWIRRAALHGNAPAWVPLLAATIMREEGKEEAAVHHLEEVYVSTQDEKTRAELRNRLISLKSKLDLKSAERDRSEFDKAHADNLPYTPPDFFALIGPRRPPIMDWRALVRHPVLDAAENADNGGTGR